MLGNLPVYIWYMSVPTDDYHIHVHKSHGGIHISKRNKIQIEL
jgi:hypothetical protein